MPTKLYPVLSRVEIKRKKIQEKEEITMAEFDYIKEFRNDHVWVVDNLLKLKGAVAGGSLGEAREIVDALDKGVGPHFLFEEEALYPALRTFLGEYIDELLGEHDGALTVVNGLKDLLSRDTLSNEQRKTVDKYISAFFVHASNCDGLALLAQRLSDEQQKEMARKFQEARATGKPLTVWARGKA
ncbi:MAG: hemerythrin domain-containing protein [bacterium]